MDALKHILISVIVAGAIIGGVFYFGPAEAPAQNVGAIAGPDIISPYFSFGGVRHWAANAEMRNASTTCAIQSPTSTSTLVAATFQVVVAPTTTPQFEIGVGTTAYATTTQLALWTFTANTRKSIAATSSVLTNFPEGIISPNTWVNVKQGGGGGSFVPTGTCTAVFREL